MLALTSAPMIILLSAGILLCGNVIHNNEANDVVGELFIFFRVCICLDLVFFGVAFLCEDVFVSVTC